MKAWQIEKQGGPEVLQRKNLPEPTIKPGEVLVQVEAVGLNHLDLWVRKGVEGHSFPLPLIPGCDISGIIAKLGSGVEQTQQVKIGAPVLINPGTSCGHCEACLGGFDPLCYSYGILGETQNGGCADFVSVPITNVIPRPTYLTAVQAAALGIPFITAWSMLTRKAQLKPGEFVLIQAGGSAVSVAAIQIAKALGATIITTVGNPNKIEKAKALGADYVIPYKMVSFREEVKKILKSHDKRGCEIVLDHVGADTFEDSLKCLSWGGRFVTCGATSGSKVEIDLKAVFFKNLSILGSTMGSKSDLLRVLELVKTNHLKPIIDQVFSMEELPQAMQKLERREAFGKVICKN